MFNIKEIISDSKLNYLFSLFNTETYWVEWASNPAIFISKYKRPHQKLFIRLHRYEMYRKKWMHRIKWENVDCVVSFNEKTPRNLYKKIMPDIITKGGDYKESEVIGKNEIAKNGGKVVIINYLRNYSSSSIKNKIIKIKKKSLR